MSDEQQEKTPQELREESDSRANDMTITYLMNSLREKIAAKHGYERAELFLDQVWGRFVEEHENGTLATPDPNRMDDIMAALEDELEDD